MKQCGKDGSKRRVINKTKSKAAGGSLNEDLVV